jgi:hypothetical protein
MLIFFLLIDQFTILPDVLVKFSHINEYFVNLKSLLYSIY